MELEVGMYIRTKDGIIDKILKLNKSYVKGVSQKDELYAYDIDNIVKASYNIIDILEVGDVIIDKEGHKYPINYEFETDYNDEYKSYEITIDDHITLFLKDGLSIVTHEQMKQMAYKVGE